MADGADDNEGHPTLNYNAMSDNEFLEAVRRSHDGYKRAGAEDDARDAGEPKSMVQLLHDEIIEAIRKRALDNIQKDFVAAHPGESGIPVLRGMLTMMDFIMEGHEVLGTNPSAVEAIEHLITAVADYFFTITEPYFELIDHPALSPDFLSLMDEIDAMDREVVARHQARRR